MTEVFSGELSGKIDGKGRVSIPSELREVMAAGDSDRTGDMPVRFILQYADNLEGHLRGWTVDAITRIRLQIRNFPNGPDKRGLSFLFNTQTKMLTVDKDGRTVIPLEQRQKMGMTEGDLAFLGNDEYFEIWRADVYQGTKSAEMERWLKSKPRDFDPLSLLNGVPEE